MTLAVEEMIPTLASMDCLSHVFSYDIIDEKRLGAVVKEIQTNSNPLYADVINCSVSCADAAFGNMTYDKWYTLIKSKVNSLPTVHRSRASQLCYLLQPAHLATEVKPTTTRAMPSKIP
ncbi:hypothetical protein BDV26DRAFT_288791 [Aspergillus bertholletiae]|uniref:Ketoreductase (KR) domain-containing protein n=1 Tax=Aspergillus bertholletiae TaxID=1226010 RepID=A0A5N7BJT6_9EURO|nr:hypothetical protein BDV26DRAFT_288791 [Aspergillus bertholletiae]